MTRKKVKLAFILNESARKATFKKRKRGLLKKINELATLCGIQACAIIHSPYECDAEVWPSPLGVHQILNKFKRMPEMEQSKKMVNQESFLRQRITKMVDQVKKYRKENREREITQVMFQGLVGRNLHGFNMSDLNDLSWVIDDHLNDVVKRQEIIHKGSFNPNPNMSIIINNNVNNSQAGAGAGDIVVAAPPVPEDVAMVEVPTPSQPMPQEVALPAEVTLEGPPGFEMGGRPQWLMDMINTQDQIPFGGPVGGIIDELLPFSDHSPSGFNWPSGYYP